MVGVTWVSGTSEVSEAGFLSPTPPDGCRVRPLWLVRPLPSLKPLRFP